MKNFAMIGAGGYIAPRHMRAIKDTGNRLVAALDKHDSVGVLDNYFPEADFFIEFERFDRHLEKLKRQGTHIDYVTICSPNYLHDAHIRFGLRIGADVICEKPLVLNPWNIDSLENIEKESGKKVFTVLQLRLHPAVLALKEMVQKTPGKMYDIELKYITLRGPWYHISWKGDLQKSGGITTNIGVHFFDILLWIFGDVTENIVFKHTKDTAAGKLKLERADVNWFLSIGLNALPEESRLKGVNTYRSLMINGEEIDFDEGFESLHSKSYENILKGKGLQISENKKLIQLLHAIRNYPT